MPDASTLRLLVQVIDVLTNTLQSLKEVCENAIEPQEDLITPATPRGNPRGTSETLPEYVPPTPRTEERIRAQQAEAAAFTRPIPPLQLNQEPSTEDDPTPSTPSSTSEDEYPDEPPTREGILPANLTPIQEAQYRARRRGNAAQNGTPIPIYNRCPPTQFTPFRNGPVNSTILYQRFLDTGVCGHYCHFAGHPRLSFCPICLTDKEHLRQNTDAR